MRRNSIFDEDIFVTSLTGRPEDAKKFSQIFRPQWLNRAEYQPILAEVYAFTKKNGEPPSLVTLHKIFKDKDSDAYELRYKDILEELQKVSADRSEQIYVLGQAKDVAISRSFLEMIKDQGFNQKQIDFDGPGMVKDVQSWLSQFANAGDDRTMDLQQAIEHLMDTADFNPINIRIPTNITVLDDWTGGGLRKKQLAVVIAPTGHGKSALLLVIGHKIAAIEEKNVWFITNELVLEEVTERALARITGTPVEEIMNDPGVAYKGLERHWTNNLNKRFVITEYNREISTDELEAELAKMANLHGWKPDVIVLDYMERMKPSLSGYKRDNEWGWMGAVAKDLVRLAKRHNMLIWTAAQTNRAGLSKGSDIDMTMAQASIRHLQEATAVIGMSQVDIPNSDRVALKLVPLKMRQSRRAGRAVELECDLSKMSITNDVIDSSVFEDEEEEEEKSKWASTPRERQQRKSKKR